MNEPEHRSQKPRSVLDLAIAMALLVLVFPKARQTGTGQTGREPDGSRRAALRAGWAELRALQRGRAAGLPSRPSHRPRPMVLALGFGGGVALLAASRVDWTQLTPSETGSTVLMIVLVGLAIGWIVRTQR